MRDQAWELQFETASWQEVRAIVLRKPYKTQRSETAFEIKSRLSGLKTAKPPKIENDIKNIVFYHTCKKLSLLRHCLGGFGLKRPSVFEVEALLY